MYLPIQNIESRNADISHYLSNTRDMFFLLGMQWIKKTNHMTTYCTRFCAKKSQYTLFSVSEDHCFGHVNVATDFTELKEKLTLWGSVHHT